MLLLRGFLKFSISEGILVTKQHIFNKSLDEKFIFFDKTYVYPYHLNYHSIFEDIIGYTERGDVKLCEAKNNIITQEQLRDEFGYTNAGKVKIKLITDYIAYTNERKHCN